MKKSVSILLIASMSLLSNFVFATTNAEDIALAGKAAADTIQLCKTTNGVCLDWTVTTGYTTFFAASGNYSFTNVSPEFRIRFGSDKISDILDFYVGLGTPLIQNLNSATTQSSELTLLGRTNVFATLGAQFAPMSFSQGAAPINLFIEAGYMNQQINKAAGNYDKGMFIELGISVPFGSSAASKVR